MGENEPFKKELKTEIYVCAQGLSWFEAAFKDHGACNPAHFPNRSFKSKAGSQMVLMSWALRYIVT